MKYLVLLTILFSCSTSQKAIKGSNEIPRWVYSPYEYCDETKELCATGDGQSYGSADAEARKNMASIFEVKIKAEFSSQTSSHADASLNASVKQSIQNSLEESVDEILEVVQIKNHFENNSLFFSLASLDRIKAGELLGERLKKLDDELKILWKNKSRTRLRKILKTFIEREKLNERFSIVTGYPKLSSISYKEILEWKESRPKEEALSLLVGQAPDWLVEKIKELLTEAGFKIVKGNTKKALVLNVDSINEYLNVDGFEKYTFTLNMTSVESGEKKQVLSSSETVTGRTQADALLKVKNLFLEYIEQKLSDLKLD